MKTYTGTKTVQARPMTRAEYNDYRGWPMPADENGADTGFLVEYLDGGKANDSRHAGYISWSPSDPFERAYREVPTDYRQRVRDERDGVAANLGERIAAFDQQDVLAVPAVLKVPADEAQTEADIQAKGLTAPRVTPEHINKLMSRVVILFSGPSSTTSTFAHAFLDGAFFLATGHSACVSPENFDAEVGMKIARANAERAARDKLWELEGYALYRSLD